jgi:Uma2 family endonuclease
MNTGLEPQVRKLTVRDYYLLAQEGNLHPEERTELVDGQIIKMLPIGFSHSNVQAKLLAQLYRQEDPSRFRIWPGGLRISDTGERYPDISLVSPTISKQPTAQDLFLLIEIADSSLTYDLTEKKNEYERAEIQEYWVVDVQDKAIFPFQLDNRTFIGLGAKSSGELHPRLFPDITIVINQLFE